MTAFICTRFAQSILVLFIMSLLVFGGVNLVGDPVEMLINPEADQAEVERVIRELGLDRPVTCLLYTSPSPRDRQKSRMPSSA